MRTAPEVVGRIRRVLAGSEASPDELRALAQEYLELCLTTQRRLEECGNFLARGLRSEAIYAAETAPPLLELMGTLEFPGAPQWCEFARQRDLPAPTPFDSNLQNLLEDEWGRQNDVEPLINQYRKLCVARAPATQRIVLLRRLRSADPANPNWPRDLELLEANRFNQIRLALRGPSPPSEEAAACYVQELTAPDLVSPAPRDLLEAAMRFHSQAAAWRFDSTIRQAAASIHESYAAMDFQAVESGLTWIDQQSRADNLAVPPDVAEALEGARAWVATRRQEMERQQQFDRACAELHGMLESAAGASGARAGSAIQLLNQALVGLEMSGCDVPSDLSAQARATIAALARRQRSRRRLKWLAASAACALLVAAVAGGTRYVLYRRDRAAMASQIGDIASKVDEFTSRYDFAAGREYVARVRGEHPSLSDAVPVQNALTRLDQAEAADKARAAELADVLRQTGDAPADTADFELRMSHAGRLARTEADREAVSTAREAADALAARKRRAVDDRIAALLVRARAACDDVRAAAVPAQIRARAATLTALLKEADTVKGASAQRTKEVAALRGQCAAELARADGIADQSRHEASARQEMLRRIQEAQSKLPDVQAYASACEKLHADYPAAPEVFAPESWKTLAPCYDAVLRASAAATESRRRGAVVPPGNPPGSAMAGFRDALASHAFAGDSPYAVTVEAMTARAAFLADSEKLTGDLRELLDHRLICDVKQFTVQLAGGAQVRYYTPSNENVTVEDGSVKFRNYDNQHRLTEPIRHVAKLVNPPQLAPHCVLAVKIKSMLRLEQEAGDWASGIPGMMQYALTFPDANPRARALVLKELSKLNDAAGNPARLPATTSKEILDLSPEYVNFLTPSDDGKVAASLADIDRRTKELTGRLSPLLKAAAAGQASFRADVAALYRPMVVSAIVGRGPDGNPAVVPLGPGPGGKPWREFWALALRDGRPVFVVAAVRRDGAVGQEPKVAWVRGTPPPPGQPILSPSDDEDTAKVAAAYALPPAAAAERPGWPVNLPDAESAKR